MRARAVHGVVEGDRGLQERGEPGEAGDADLGVQDGGAVGTIITTEATDAAGCVRPCMPLAVAPDDWNAWLDPAHQNTDELRAMLATPAAGQLDARPVSTAVNNVRNNSPDLLDATTDT